MYVERLDVGASLAADLEDTEVMIIIEFDKLGFIDGLDMELLLDG